MKKVEAIIDPYKIDEVKNALTKIGVRRMTLSRVGEFRSQKAHKEVYRGMEYNIDVVKEFKIELTVDTDDMLCQVIETIEQIGNLSDEDIFVSPMEKVTRDSDTKKGGRNEKNRSHCQTI